ncbi:hypothetical protein FPL11_04445 [Spiribacter aquaticus]|uniref:Uncharacterized protein n=1 Tax=Spiribacter aquaticus TaxID=1935996 RepID=A0A557RJJ6_9GAMM|nr:MULTISPECIES: hypothetical protein [Spiribacter]TVO65341.1 hypothetical protein FPL11_04445 [Spiribacter aquaticus]
MDRLEIESGVALEKRVGVVRIILRHDYFTDSGPVSTGCIVQGVPTKSAAGSQDEAFDLRVLAEYVATVG